MPDHRIGRHRFASRRALLRDPRQLGGHPPDITAPPVSFWPATPRRGRRSTWRAALTRGLKRSTTFRNYTHSLSQGFALGWPRALPDRWRWEGSSEALDVCRYRPVSYKTSREYSVRKIRPTP